MTDYQPLAAHSTLGLWAAYDANQVTTFKAIASEVGSERLVEGCIQILMRVTSAENETPAEKAGRLRQLGGRVEMLTRSTKASQRLPESSLEFGLALADAISSITARDIAADEIAIPRPELTTTECGLAIMLVTATVGVTLRGTQESYAPLIAELRADFWSMEARRLNS